MNPATTDTARKAIRYLKAQVGAERLTAGSLPNETGMVVAVRRATLHHSPEHYPENGSAANGSAENGSTSNGSINHSGHDSTPPGGTQTQLQALLIVADEGVDKASLLEEFSDDTPIGETGEVVGEHTRTGILSWQQTNKEADGTLTESYVVSMAAELIQTAAKLVAPDADDHRPDENGHHRLYPEGEPEPATTAPGDDTEAPTGQPEHPGEGATEFGPEQDPAGQYQPDQQHAPASTVPSDEASGYDGAPAATEAPDTSPGADYKDEVEDQDELEDAPGPPANHDSSYKVRHPLTKAAYTDAAGSTCFVLKDSVLEEQSEAELEHPHPAHDHAGTPRPQQSGPEEASVGEPGIADHNDEGHLVPNGPAQSGAHEGNEQVWRMLQAGAADHGQQQPTTPEPERAEPDPSEMDTTELDASEVASALTAPEDDTAELPTAEPQVGTGDETPPQHQTGTAGDHPGEHAGQDPSTGAMDTGAGQTGSEQEPDDNAAPETSTPGNTDPHATDEASMTADGPDQDNDDPSGQDQPEGVTAPHTRFEEQLHDREPQARPYAPQPAEDLGTDNETPDSTRTEPNPEAEAGAELDESHTGWLQQMSSGRTKTPEQRAYLAQMQRMNKLTSRLTFKKPPEPPPKLAPAHTIEGLTIQRITSFSRGAGVIVPMISKGGTGKTTMAVETAFKGAAMTGDDGSDAPNPTAKVLLVDMNLTNPDLAARVHVTGSGKTGVKDVLAGEPLSRVVHRTAMPNLDVLFMLGLGDEDLQLLTDEFSDPRTVQQLISALVTGGDYDIIVVDTANALPGIESNPASMMMTMWASVADARYLALEPEKAAFENAWTFTRRLGEAVGHERPVVPVLNSFPLQKVYEQAPIPPEYNKKRRGALEAVSFLQQSEAFPVVPGLTIKGEELETPLMIPSYPEEVKGFAAEGRPLSLYSETFARAYRRIVLDAVRRMLDNGT